MTSANLVFLVFSPGPSQERDPRNEVGQLQHIYLSLNVLMKRTFYYRVRKKLSK